MLRKTIAIPSIWNLFQGVLGGIMNHKNTIGYEIKTLDNLFFRNLLSYETSQNNMDEVTVMHGWILAFIA